MKKMISVTLVLVLVLSVFSGCHGSIQRKDFVVPEEFDTSREYEISFWAKNDTNNDQVAVYKKAVEDFQKLYPNIKVNIKWYTDYSRMYQDVITNIATDTTPNVCITYPDHIATYMTSNNCVVPLDELMADEKYGLGGSELRFDGVTKDQIVSQFLEEGVLNGKQYALPFMRSTEACYVNKTYVEKLGFELPETLTWDFIWEVAEAAMEKDEDGNYLVNGQKTLIPVMYKSTDNMMIQMLKQLDAGYSTDDGEIEIFNEITEQLLYFIAERAENGTFSTFKIESYPANFLNRGQCIFAIDSTAGATWMGSDAPLMDINEEEIVEFETVAMVVPQFDVDTPQMISQGPSVCVFNKSDDQEVLASWLFAQFLLTNDVQIAYAQTEGYAPVTTKAHNSSQYKNYLSGICEDGQPASEKIAQLEAQLEALKGNKDTPDEKITEIEGQLQQINALYYSIKLDATKILLDNIENTFVTPVFNGSASLRNAAGQLIEEVTKGVQRGKTVDEAFMEKLQNDMVSLYHLDEIRNGSTSKEELGQLPQASVLLLTTLGIAWLGLAVFAVVGKRKERRISK